MSGQEQKTGSDIEQIGKVRWGFKSSGYAGGLDNLGKKMDPKEIKYFPVMIFAREVALGTTSSHSVQQDPRLLGEKLIEKGLLTEEERDYVYSQFGFDPNKFESDQNK